MLNNA